MGQDNKTVKRYRRKVLKLERENKNLEYKLTILQAHLDVADSKIKELELPSNAEAKD